MLIKRKEVRLGLSIGGVLLAVVVVYLLVVTAGPDKPQTVTLEQPQTPAQAPVQPQVDPPQPVVADTPREPLIKPAETTTNDPWTQVLATGHVPVLLTETPGPAPQVSAPPAPVPAAANTPTPPAGAGTLGTSVPIVASNVGAAISSAGPLAPPGPATRSTESTSMRTHVVREGETYASIAAAAYGNASYYPHLIRANPTIEARKLRPGMTINLPPAGEVRVDQTARPAASSVAATAVPLDPKTEYRVTDGDSLERISLKLWGKRDRTEKLYELNKTTIGPDPARLKIGMVLKLPEPPTAR